MLRRANEYYALRCVLFEFEYKDGGCRIVSWQVVQLLFGVATLVVVFIAVQVAYFVALCKRIDRNTDGLSYYGLSLAERRRFKRNTARQAALVAPLLWLLSRMGAVTMDRASFVYHGIAGPKDCCNEGTYRQAVTYQPNAQDIFVVTQMKCGTTWMQYLVYQVLTRGEGSLVQSGQALYAISPWIESEKSVGITEAPLIGLEHPKRIIKTHLPIALCPFNTRASYIYVSRHPLSCFASTVDFVRMSLGPLDISLDLLEDWFCSDKMWWGTWPDHIRGWWHASLQHPNVLFIQFEDMKDDFEAATRKVAAFLGISDLTADEIDRIVQHCSFDCMQANAEAFEMCVPTVLQSNLQPLVKGTSDRYRGVPDEVSQRLRLWVREALTGGQVPLDDLYPDVANPNSMS